MSSVGAIASSAIVKLTVLLSNRKHVSIPNSLATANDTKAIVRSNSSVCVVASSELSILLVYRLLVVILWQQ